MLQPGDQLGRYQIQRRLGQGGMGTLYLARDPVLERPVAVKLFLGDLDRKDTRARFTQEARAVASLSHSNIVTVYDYGEVSSQPYIVMEFIEGETIADLIRDKAPIEAADKLRWLEQLCEGVAYAHRIGIIHRDIKPANLMIDRLRRLKVLDFGIARMRGTLASNSTALLGTPGYMAPEQLRGGTVDHRSDLFSIGVVAYELLCYVEAFPGDTMHAITRRILEEAPVPIIDLVPGIHPDLARIIERALEKHPSTRFQDANEMRVALAGIRQQLETGSVSDSGPARDTTSTITSYDAISLSPSPEAVAATVLAPRSGGRRTDREALFRRRAAQIEAGLNQARALLEAGNLDAAQTACEKVLTLDETDAQAVEVYRSIERARARRGLLALITHARRELERGALTVSAELLRKARALDPAAPEVDALESDLRVARTEHDQARKQAEEIELAISSSQQALTAGDLDVALRHVRGALALESGHDRALRLEKEILAKLDAVGAKPGALGTDATVLLLAADTARAASRPSVVTDKAPFLARTIGFVKATANRWIGEALEVWRQYPVRTRSIAIAVATTGIAAIGVAAWLAMGHIPPPAQGTVIIDAVPWGTVTAITAVDGSGRQQVPAAAQTPLALHLAPGRYRVSISGPPPESISRVVDLQVESGGVTNAPLQRFNAITAEEYFDQYLQAPSPATEPTP
jgi:tetratricopeptide (TPR) repeat protein